MVKIIKKKMYFANKKEKDMPFLEPFINEAEDMYKKIVKETNKIPLVKTKHTNWRNCYPLDTFYGETRRELIEFVEIIIKKTSEDSYERGHADAIKWKNLTISVLMNEKKIEETRIETKIKTRIKKEILAKLPKIKFTEDDRFTYKQGFNSALIGIKSLLKQL